MKTLLLILLLSFSCAAQNLDSDDYEYGKPEELRGMTKVFIDTHGDTQTRDKVTRLMADRLPELKFVNSIDDAEVTIIYVQAGYIGIWLVAIPSPKDPNTPRVLMSYKYDKARFFAGPEKRFTAEFVKVYRKANGK
jgi:hypothetical protein